MHAFSEQNERIKTCAPPARGEIHLHSAYPCMSHTIVVQKQILLNAPQLEGVEEHGEEQNGHLIKLPTRCLLILPFLSISEEPAMLYPVHKVGR